MNGDQTNLLCELFPFLSTSSFTNALCGQGDVQGGAQSVVGQVFELIQFAASFILVGIIAYAIFIIIKAAIKYIQSEGDETKVEEASKAIKTVFIGIAALILSIIGLVIIIALSGLNLGSEQEPPEILDPLVPSGATSSSQQSRR